MRTTLLALALLLASLYLPLAFMVYHPAWYELNCNWHQRCNQLGPAMRSRSIDNLTAFFAHREPLNRHWSRKERVHLAEVRNIYDTLAPLALGALLVAWANADARRLRRATLINIGFIAALLLLLPAFGWFWRHVFHELLFANELWKTDRSDLTWYLTPRSLFRNAVIAMVAAGVTSNAVLYLLARDRLAGTQEPGHPAD